MKPAAAVAFCLAAMTAIAPAMAQSQNAAQTGVGKAINSIQALQGAASEHWAGPPGQVVKGAVGLAGMAAALMSAQDALNFKLRVRGDGSVDSGVSTSKSTATSVLTSNSTSSSTSTN